jgi:hypothetical protein
MTISAGYVLAKFTQVKKAVYRSQKMVLRDIVLKTYGNKTLSFLLLGAMNISSIPWNEYM